MIPPILAAALCVELAFPGERLLTTHHLASARILDVSNPKSQLPEQLFAGQGQYHIIASED